MHRLTSVKPKVYEIIEYMDKEAITITLKYWLFFNKMPKYRSKGKNEECKNYTCWLMNREFCKQYIILNHVFFCSISID